ncbi:hypothetical protein [Alteromonas sp. ASW11-130]|uniref:hypothetical protein n=1 Tax=Alteromonas sp. ASW11-130 TaxID=3015775 RepID=UPI0022429872|nr:hypothetical protein [Alteromonas sp. ASW11-130]MCW8092665.1 hypothetical protein [Alteromonas sp. ASW11-130]
MRYWLKLIKTSVVWITLIIIHPAFAQSVSMNHQQFWQVFEQTYAQTSTVMETPQFLADAVQLLNKACAEDILPHSISPYLEQQAEYWKHNYGIELRGGLTSGDIESSDIDEQGSTYVELSWDILDNGYKEFQYRSNDFQRKALLEKVLHEIRRQSLEYRCREYQINAQFDNTLLHLKRTLLSLMEKVYRVEEEAYFMGDSYFDDLLLSEESVIQLRYQVRELENNAEGHANVINPPLIDVDIDAVLKASLNNTSLHAAEKLRRQEYANTNPYDDGARLRLFLRKELNVLSSDRDDLVAGLRFSVPINFKHKVDSSIKIRQFEKDAQVDNWERSQRTKNAYASFQEQLQRVITQKYRYKRANERIRRTLVKRTLDESLRPSAVAARLKNYAEAAIELLEAKRELYARINNIFLVSQVPFATEMLAPSPTVALAERHRPNQRSMYFWSSTFNQLSNTQLHLLLRTKRIHRPVISFSEKTNLPKLKDFITELSRKNRPFELMLSTNTWIRRDKRDQALAQIAKVKTYSNAIHLDIEPQVLADYKQNRERYQQDYVELIGAIKERYPDLYLSLSVPFHWDEKTYRQLKPLAERMYVMLYETPVAEVVKRRANKLIPLIGKDKFIAALRTKDFANEYEMERMIRTLAEDGIHEFAVHDAEEVINWEQLP